MEERTVRPVGRQKVSAKNSEDRMKAVAVEKTGRRYVCEIKCIGLGN